MAHRIHLFVLLLLAVCLVRAAIFPALAQRGRLLTALLLNGDFEGDFYAYGSGYVAEHWVPYDFALGTLQATMSLSAAAPAALCLSMTPT
jgi:hypothetical protein